MVLRLLVSMASMVNANTRPAEGTTPPGLPSARIRPVCNPAWISSDFRNARIREICLFQRGASRYVFTTDVSVDEVQAFIRGLVRVLSWFTPLGPYGC